VDELIKALKDFQIEALESLLRLYDLEESGLRNSMQSPDSTDTQRIFAIERCEQISIEKEIILQRLADLGPPLRIAPD
jgi:hypothetical protein